MRFIVMHKVDADMEAGCPPSKEIISKMGQLVHGSIKSGVFKDGAGLHPSTKRARVEHAGDKRTVTMGPLTGNNELVERFAMIKARSLDEAIEHAGRFAKIFGDVEIEIGPVVEPWDLMGTPKPPRDEPGRFLLLQKSTADAERGVPLKPAAQQAFDALKKEMTEQGVLLAAQEIAPSSKGSRLPSGKNSKRTWTDGPFAESKELIAGYSILEVPSKADAIAWADEYAAILEGSEVDVRELQP